MNFALIFTTTVVVSIVLAKVIRKVPWLFYSLAIAAVIVLYAGEAGWIDGVWWKPFILPIRRCMIALSLFATVMFTGALSSDSKLGFRLRSVRSELSVIACLLCVGHIMAYVLVYLSRLLEGSLEPAVLGSICVAILLAGLLVVLGATSFVFVKKRMPAVTWKHVQRLAYPFFVLIYVHLLLMLAPAALSGSAGAFASVTGYTLLFGTYVIARVVRWRKDCKCGLVFRKEEAAIDAFPAESISR